MGSNSSGYDVVVKLHEAPGRVSSSMKLQQAAAAAAPGPPGCCRSSPSSSYLQAQNQSRSLGVASSEIVQLHHHRHHHHLHGSLSLQADDDPESLMPSEFNKQLVSKTTSFHIPESGTFPLTFAPGTYFHRDRRWRSPFSTTQLRASSSSRRSLHHSWNLAWILTKCMQRTHSLQTDCSNSPCFASNDSTVEEEEEEEGSSSVFIGRHQSSRIMHCTCCCGCWRSESDCCCCGLWVGACFLSFFLSCVCVCARALARSGWSAAGAAATRIILCEFGFFQREGFERCDGGAAVEFAFWSHGSHHADRCSLCCCFFFFCSSYCLEGENSLNNSPQIDR